MNYLAHIYLSGENDQIKIGNFMADGIKGKQLDHFPIEIQKGIQLHRTIDIFTDTHSIFRQSKKRLYPTYGHYAAVIVDIYYDHFLAKNWQNYCAISLADYIADFYQKLEQHYPILPDKIQKLVAVMISENWLLKYAEIEGIKNILIQMDQRTGNISKMRLATIELIDFYPIFEKEFSLFFYELQTYTRNILTIL